MIKKCQWEQKINPEYVPNYILLKLYKGQLKIEKEKLEHLMVLKNSIEKDYNNLTHE